MGRRIALAFPCAAPLVCVCASSVRGHNTYTFRERESLRGATCVMRHPRFLLLVSCVLIWLSVLARDSFRACHSLCCAHRNDAFGMQTGPSCESPIHPYIVCVGLCAPAVAI